MIFLSILTINNPCYADDVVVLPKGSPAPYSGYLFTMSKGEETYKLLKECDTQKQANISLLKSLTLMQDNRTLLDKEISELKDQNNNLDTTLQKIESQSTWTKVIYFGLGVVTTGLIVYAVKK